MRVLAGLFLPGWPVPGWPLPGCPLPRSRRRAAFAALGAILSVAPRAGGATSEAAQAVQTITRQDLAHHIEILASDAFEGREPGTPGEAKTLDYLVGEFQRIGVAPGNGGSYLQKVPMVEVTPGPPPAFSIQADAAVVTFEPRAEFLVGPGRPVGRVSIRNAPVVFAGYGIQAPEYGWDDYAGADLRGAVVIVMRTEPASETDSLFFRGRDLTAHGAGAAKYDLAAKLGARAILVIHTEATAGYPWSTLSGGGGNSQMFLADRRRATQLELVAHVSEPAARKLFAAAQLDFDALTARAGTPGFAAVPTKIAASFDWSGHTRRVTSHNVVAYIRGREAPDECILHTAHWDHVGRNPKLQGDQIFNGAVDNATGTAALLELAEAYRALPRPPRRSVYFIATTAEEKGLKGAEYYTRHPIVPLAKTAAVLNMDAHFPFGSYTYMTTLGLGLSELDDILAASAAGFGRQLQPDPMPEAGAFYRADTYPFVKIGVPALFSVGGPGPDEPEDSALNQRFADYIQHGYHKPADEYDAATWDLSGVEGDTRVYFETGRRIAEDSQFPNWRYGTEFRRLRDAMRTPAGRRDTRSN